MNKRVRKWSNYDPIPTWLLNKCASALVLIITNRVDLSLSTILEE